MYGLRDLDAVQIGSKNAESGAGGLALVNQGMSRQAERIDCADHRRMAGRVAEGDTPTISLQQYRNSGGMALAATEVVMLHSLHPAQFVVADHLGTSRDCPQCDHKFLFGDGVMSLAHYRYTETGEVKQGLMCFCSTKCLLLWEHPTMLGLMH